MERNERRLEYINNLEADWNIEWLRIEEDCILREIEYLRQCLDWNIWKLKNLDIIDNEEKILQIIRDAKQKLAIIKINNSEYE